MAAAVVGAHYCTGHALELIVSEKKMSLSGESYEIADSEGKLLFKMHGHALNVRDKCTLLDRDGNPILSASKKLLSMHDTWEVSSGKYVQSNNSNSNSNSTSTSINSHLFIVKKSSFFQMKTSLDVFLAANKNHDPPDFRVKGNFSERKAQILQGDTVIAEVKRKYSATNVILDKHVFSVEVKPHVDLAFVATLIIIMHEIQDD